MVVDDEESVLISTGLLLRLLKYDFITFNNPAEALNYIHHNNDIDLILLDIMMPVIDGYEFLKRLQHITVRPNTKIILHTGIEDQTYIDKCLQAGADDCLKKPYVKQQFIDILEKHLG